MTGDEQGHRDLDVLPDELVGKAIKDRDFRNAVFKAKGDREGLKKLLADNGFNALSDAALDFIQNLSRDKVNGVLRDIDIPADQAFDAGDDPQILAS